MRIFFLFLLFACACGSGGKKVEPVPDPLPPLLTDGITKCADDPGRSRFSSQEEGGRTWRKWRRSYGCHFEDMSLFVEVTLTTPKSSYVFRDIPGMLTPMVSGGNCSLSIAVLAHRKGDPHQRERINALNALQRKFVADAAAKPPCD